jgi:hypothetical protein
VIAIHHIIINDAININRHRISVHSRSTIGPFIILGSIGLLSFSTRAVDVDGVTGADGYTFDIFL